MLQAVKENAKKLQNRAGNNKQMPNKMHIIMLFVFIKEHTESICNSAGNKENHAVYRNGEVDISYGNNNEPTHNKIKHH